MTSHLHIFQHLSPLYNHLQVMTTGIFLADWAVLKCSNYCTDIIYKLYLPVSLSVRTLLCISQPGSGGRRLSTAFAKAFPLMACFGGHVHVSPDTHDLGTTATSFSSSNKTTAYISWGVNYVTNFTQSKTLLSQYRTAFQILQASKKSLSFLERLQHRLSLPIREGMDWNQGWMFMMLTFFRLFLSAMRG